MSGARPDTWMPLYVGDYLADTGHLSTEEHGAYLLLIMPAWTRGGTLPSDEQRLRALCRLDAKRWARSRDALLAFFYLADDGYRHKRVDQEIGKAARFIEKQTQNGQKGGRPRKPDKTQTETQQKPTALPKAKPEETTPQPPSHSTEFTQPPSPEPARAESVLAQWGGAVKAIMEAQWPTDPRVPMAQAGIVDQWKADGYDLELDVLPTVRQVCADKIGDPITTLKYFTDPIRRRHAERTTGAASKVASVAPKGEAWNSRVADYRREIDAGTPREQTFWHRVMLLDWGPEPGQPQCRAPGDVLAKHGFDDMPEFLRRKGAA